MKKKLFQFALLLFVLTFNNAFSQSDVKAVRREFELESKSDEIFVVPAGKEGLIVFEETEEKTGKGMRAWEFKKLNTKFEDVWTKSTSIGKRMEFEKFYQDGNFIYILLVDIYIGKGEMARCFEDEFTVVKLDVITGNITTATGQIPYITTVNDFKVVNDVAYFGGSTVPSASKVCVRSCLVQAACNIPLCFGAGEFKTNATLISVDMKTSKINYPALNYKGSSKLAGLGEDTLNKTMISLLTNKIDKKTYKTELKIYKSNGDLLKTIPIDTKGKNELIDASVTKITENKSIVLGSFSTPLEKQSIFEKLFARVAPTTSAFAEGVYISKFENDKQQYIKYYKFTDFKNFFSYLGKSGEASVEKKIKKKKAKGKDLNLNYALLVHDIVKSGDEYIFVGEAYYKEYHTETYTVNGKTQSRRVFDGYRYTHAVIASFDEDGKMLWDNSFPIWNILTFELKERVKVMTINSKVVLAYNYNGQLESKVINGNKLENYKTIPIASTYSDDKIKSQGGSDLLYWYDNYFVAYGYQVIKNKNADEKQDKDLKKKRRVLYLNKVVFK